MSRKNVSITAPIEERAEAIIKKRGFTGLSDMIAVLVREEYERRGLTEASSQTKPPTKPHSATSVDISPLAAVLNDAIGEPSQSLPQNSPATPHTGSTHKGVSYPKPGQSNAPKRKRAHKGSKQ